MFIDINKSRGSSPGGPACYDVQKQSIPPIPGLKLSNKVDKSRTMPAYIPGLPPRMVADKCICRHSTYVQKDINSKALKTVYEVVYECK